MKTSSLRKRLLTSKEWLRLAAEGCELGLWYWDEVTQTLFWDTKTREIFGVNPDGDVTLETFYQAVHPSDLPRVRTLWRYQLESGVPCDLEYRVQRQDGSMREIHARGTGYYNDDTEPIYMVGVVFDITESRKSQQERIDLCGRLINAQEQERRRLAMELHDDIGQRLVVATTELEALAQKYGTKELNLPLERSITLLQDVMQDLHLISYRLHSSRLELLGLVPSLTSLCVDFERQRGIRTKFHYESVPAELPAEMALSLFRIVQEALQNVSKHSGASQVEVRLEGKVNEITLTILDNGTGFDLKKSSFTAGLGIHSMRERTFFLQGTFGIQSRPSVQGTRIVVSVPKKSTRIAA